MAELDLEYEYYESIKEELLREHEGKFALSKSKNCSASSTPTTTPTKSA